MKNIFRGLYAGFLASLLLAALYSVDDGSGNDLLRGGQLVRGGD